MARLRILVSGGSGFLGSHLCERLLGDGHEVVCLDNFFTGTRVNVEHLLDNHRFELVRHDVTEPLTLEVDEVYHLACPASPIHYQRNPVRTTRTARATGATSTPSARGPATTRGSAARRRWPCRTRASTASRCASFASST